VQRCHPVPYSVRPSSLVRKGNGRFVTRTRSYSGMIRYESGLVGEDLERIVVDILEVGEDEQRKIDIDR